ncbi:MAG TPA: hypothetical protein VK158_02015 [Acidobacteriota bacterium]|nr:hypothetical protein [Acidobacteriota bacterium]
MKPKTICQIALAAVSLPAAGLWKGSEKSVNSAILLTVLGMSVQSFVFISSYIAQRKFADYHPAPPKSHAEVFACFTTSYGLYKLAAPKETYSTHARSD